MPILLKNHIENAVESLRSNRMRTLLTMLGVTIGVACISTVLALANGATKLVTQQGEVSENLIVVRSGVPQAPEAVFSGQSTATSTTTLTENDVVSISDIKDVTGVAPMMNLRSAVKSEGRTIDTQHTMVVGTTPDFLSMTKLQVKDGQFIDTTDATSTAVIGNQLSIDLFGTDQAVGKVLQIRGRTFTVVGTLAPINQPINYNNIDFDRAALINLKSARSFTQDVAQIQQINIRTKDGAATKEIAQKVGEVLAKNHLGEKDYTIQSGKAIARPTAELFSTVSLMSIIIAVISLIVGGIGIMNIMLVNVAERVREVGVRKALGASSGHIINQYLIESVIIGLVGGVTGYVLGFLVALGLSSVLPISPALDWQTPVIALAVSLIVGVVFGLYPALRAAHREPIESLRHG